MPRQRFNERDRGKPDIEARARTGRALHIHSPAVIQDNLADHRETETVSFGSRCKEWLEDSLEQRLVHAAPLIDDRNDDIVTGHDLAMAQLQCPSDFPRVDFDLDPSC